MTEYTNQLPVLDDCKSPDLVAGHLLLTCLQVNIRSHGDCVEARHVLHFLYRTSIPSTLGPALISRQISRSSPDQMPIK
jgi:hypothetical protein